MNVININNGFNKNCLLKFSNDLNIKSTIVLIRKIIFNILKYKLLNSYCLDLFCGSGILGLECIYLNSKFVLFNDINFNLIKLLKKNLIRLKINSFKFSLSNLFFKKLLYQKYLNIFDILFLDPPFVFYYNLFDLVCFSLSFLKFNGIIYIECIILNNIFISLFLYFKILKYGYIGRVCYFFVAGYL